MTVYIIFTEEDIVVLSLPYAKYLDSTGRKLDLSVTDDGELAINIVEKVSSELSEQERAMIDNDTEHHYGRDMITPLFIPNVYNENDNVTALQSMISQMKLSESEHLKIEDFDLGKNVFGYIISMD